MHKFEWDKMAKAIDSFKARNPKALDGLGCGTGALGIMNELIGAIICGSGLIEENAKLKEQLTWQPIETAPKSSKTILVYCSERSSTYTVRWGELNGTLRGLGWKLVGCNEDLQYVEPTHWMPIPEYDNK